MAYPLIQGPYGLKPINLIGGQFYGGGIRMFVIPYNYGTSIFYGDLVLVSHGLLGRAAVTTTDASMAIVGVFLGCSFTDPITKQKRFSQYYPANTLAGDILAVVADDPDLVFKAVVCSATTVVGSGSQALVGQNMQLIDNAGNVNTGDSKVALQGLTTGAPPTTATFPIRVLDLVRDTAVAVAVPYTSISTTTITVPALVAGTVNPGTNTLVVGSDVGVVMPNGQVQQTGAFITATYAIGATSLVTDIDVSAIIPNTAGILIITQYPELLVKLNQGAHSYNNATAIA